MDVPAGWEVRSFASVADYSAGRTPARAQTTYWDESGAGTPWVSIADMSPFGFIRSTKERVSGLAVATVFGGRIVPAGTLLMSYKLTIGRISTLGIPACHNEAIIAIRPREGVDRDFLGYALSQVDFEKLQDRQIKGNTLNREKLDRIELLLPPIAEQRTIAAILGDCRLAAELQDRALVESTELKRTTMQLLFSRGLRREPLRQTEIGLMPESWMLEPLHERHSVASGATPSRARADYWLNGSIPWVKTTEIRYDVISTTDECITERALAETPVRLFPAGTLLMAMYGQGLTRGRVAILGIDAACNQACAAIAPTRPGIDSRYLFHFLAYRYDSIRAKAHGGQQQNLSLEIVKSLKVAVPQDQAEQREIASLLDSLDRKIDFHRRKRAVLNELFKLLISSFTTGEIPASQLNLGAAYRRQQA